MTSSQINEIFDKTSFLHGANTAYIEEMFEKFQTDPNNVPNDWTWSAFSLGKNQMPYAAASLLAGGNIRVGLEDNLYLEKGTLAKNEQLVSKAVDIASHLGSRILSPEAVREKLGLIKRKPQ